MTEEQRTERRAWLFRGWQELRAACNKQHPRRAGGAAMCICGAGGGGSHACQMLATLRDLIRYLPDESLSPEWRERLDLFRGVM